MELLPEELFDKELEAKDLIRNYLKNSAVSISGGKDSLVTLDLSIRAGVKKFVFGNTTLNLPGTEEYIHELEDYYNIKIEEVRPERPFLDLVQDIGYPSRRLRWCCEVYKFGPLTNYVLKKKIKYLITGLRSDESQKRKSYSKISKNPLIHAVQLNPILYWSEQDIWEYIKYYNLPYHSLYDNGYDRLGCWLCPFQKKKTFDNLKTIFPKLYETLIESLKRNIEKFGGVGIRDVDDYIKNHGWITNALPIRNLLVGKITYKKKGNKKIFSLECLKKESFLNLLENLRLINKKSEFHINKDNFTIEIVSDDLTTNEVLIYCEKQVNCVGCGACRSLCNNNAIFIRQKRMYIDFSKCSYCKNCLRTTKLRAGCIARNYRPIRKKFDLINLDGKDLNLNNEFFKNTYNKTDNSKFISINKLGLIKTRKKIEFISGVLDEYLHPASKSHDTYIYSTTNYILKMSKDKGFTTIHFNCINDDAKEHIDDILNLLKNER